MDTLDELISTRRMEPQLAIKIMQNFDKALADVISEKVKARMSFKVCAALRRRLPPGILNARACSGSPRHLPLL